jgi:hypothetical protein
MRESVILCCLGGNDQDIRDVQGGDCVDNCTGRDGDVSPCRGMDEDASFFSERPR